MIRSTIRHILIRENLCNSWLCLLVLIFFSACQSKEETGRERNKNPIAYDTPKDISEVEVHFPPAAGEKEFISGCITCHSLRYIEMQPDFSKKSWEKIVDKMIKTFGAPIPDSTAKIIVDYLVTVKGKK